MQLSSVQTRWLNRTPAINPEPINKKESDARTGTALFFAMGWRFFQPPFILCASSLSAHWVAEEVGVGESYAVGKLGGVRPAERLCLADIEQLARRAVGLAAVPSDGSLISYDLRNGLGKQLPTAPGIYIVRTRSHTLKIAIPTAR